jgi:hypothetical protein
MEAISSRAMLRAVATGDSVSGARDDLDRLHAAADLLADELAQRVRAVVAEVKCPAVW